MLTDRLQNMELEDVSHDIPVEELNKLLKLSVIIDEGVRAALQKVK
jgi:hypothetical protein